MMLDTSIRFINNDVDSKRSDKGCGERPFGIWQAIHTRSGKEVVGEY